MKLIERSSYWHVHYADTAGTRQRASTKVRIAPNLPDRGKSLAMLAGIELIRTALFDAAPAEDRRATASKPQLTIGQALQASYANRWRDQKSAKSKRYMIDVLIKEIGYWTLAGTTHQRLQDYAKELRDRGDSAATRNRKMSAIQTAMTDAQANDKDLVMPKFPRWKENNVKERYVSHEEEAALLAWLEGNAAPADNEAQYLKHLVPFLIDTGMRASEALTLTPMQDRGDSAWLRHGSTKNDKGRVVPLSDRARVCLTAMMVSPMRPLLLAWYQQDPEKPVGWAGRRFRTATDALKLGEVTLHTLRHTCASRLVEADVDLYSIKDWLGHSSITITERYAHLAPKKSFDALAKLKAFGTRKTEEETVSSKELDPVVFGTRIGEKVGVIRDLRGAKGETRSGSCPEESGT